MPLVWRGGGSSSTSSTSSTSTSASASMGATAITNLQQPHEEMSPSEKLASLAEECDQLRINSFDVYGDFDKDEETSYLRRFETQVAQTLGMEDAVFMPSGVMAQSIALLIHSSSRAQETSSAAAPGSFACHASSHLMLHEQDAYHELLGMNAVVLDTQTKKKKKKEGVVWGGVPPLTFAHVQQALTDNKTTTIHTLLLELPHRELGGKLTPWQHVVQMSQWCRQHDIAFHCDGARLFEASAGYGLSLPEITCMFDSVYISFYKGLGALSGAMLLGSPKFCAEARIWLRRLGGNLYTWLPLAVSCWSAFQRHYPAPDAAKKKGGSSTTPIVSFAKRLAKLQRIVALLSADPVIAQWVTFDPAIPETNMVHGYLAASMETCMEARDQVQHETRTSVLSRMQSCGDGVTTTKFEWTMGNANGCIKDKVFVSTWRLFCQKLAAAEAKSRPSP